MRKYRKRVNLNRTRNRKHSLAAREAPDAATVSNAAGTSLYGSTCLLTLPPILIHEPFRKIHSLSLTPELDTRKFEIPGLLISSVELLRCQVIQR